MVTVIHFFSTLRVAQTAIQLKNKHIAGCTTRNIKLFLNTFGFYNPQYKIFLKKICIAGCRTRNVFKRNFVLQVVQPAAVV